MKIKALQKTTLLDYPGKIACTIFIFGCNFRCGFCHNPELVVEEFSNGLKPEEVLEFLEKRKTRLEGVCITGGEPLISLEESFLRAIKDLGYLIKIDTNGSFPDKLESFISKGLIDYVAMDIKSSKERYDGVAGAVVDVSKIERSIKIICSSGVDYEFRTTVVEKYHDVEEIKKMMEWLKGICSSSLGEGKMKKFALQGFRNQGKFIDSSFNDEKDIGETFLEELKFHCQDFFEDVEVRV